MQVASSARPVDDLVQSGLQDALDDALAARRPSALVLSRQTLHVKPFWPNDFMLAVLELCQCRARRESPRARGFGAQGSLILNQLWGLNAAAAADITMA